jgi:hypothetical protein
MGKSIFNTSWDTPLCFSPLLFALGTLFLNSGIRPRLENRSLVQKVAWRKKRCIPLGTTLMGVCAPNGFLRFRMFFSRFFHFTFYLQPRNHSTFHIFCPIHS